MPQCDRTPESVRCDTRFLRSTTGILANAFCQLRAKGAGLETCARTRCVRLRVRVRVRERVRVRDAQIIFKLLQRSGRQGASFTY